MRKVLLTLVFLFVGSLFTETLLAKACTFILTKERKTAIVAEYQSGDDPYFMKIANQVIKEADFHLTQPPLVYKLTSGHLLTKSRDAIRSIGHLSMAWHLTGKKVYLERALVDMEAAAAFPSWNPSHFLDVAEMSAAIAIGLDWLKEGILEIAPEKWDLIANALIEKGLKPGLRGYEGNQWWTRGRNNWTQVCNGGLTLAALAVKEKAPELSAKILTYAKRSMPKLLWVYNPDGSYPEGGVYWKYGTSYQILMADALYTAEGKLPRDILTPNFVLSYQSILESTDYFSQSFNYGDGILPVNFENVAMAITWLARISKDKAAMETLLSRIESDPTVKLDTDRCWRWNFLNLIYACEDVEFESYSTSSQEGKVPITGEVADAGRLRLWKGAQPLAIWKAGEGERQLFVATKGGSAGFSHSQMDIGSFVAYKNGIRWVLDVGRDDYYLPGYWDFSQNGGRWKIYRHSVEAHNLLRPSGASQRVNERAEITLGKDESPHPDFLEMDLTAVWKGSAKEIKRRIKVIDEHYFYVEDAFTDATASPIWQMQTEARVTVEKGHLLLEKDGKRCRITVTGMANPRWELLPSAFKTPKIKRDGVNKGITLLRFAIPNRSGKVTVHFRFDNEDTLVNDDGAYCWFSSPRAIYVTDKTDKKQLLTGWVKSDGSVEAALIDPVTKKSQTHVLHAKMEVDDHDNPSFLQLTDGRFMTFYGKHSTHAGIYMRTSTNPRDFSLWDKEVTLKLHDPDRYKNESFAKRGRVTKHYAYSNPYQLTDFNNRIYLFWRGYNYKPNVSYSDDQGKNWTPSQIVITEKAASTYVRPYVRYFSDNKKTIHMLFTNGHPRDEKLNSVYYVCLRGDTFYKADGTLITTLDKLPFSPEDADCVYDAKAFPADDGGGRAWIWDVVTDDAGAPVVAYTRLPTEKKHQYYVARFQDGEWKHLKVADAGRWFPQTPKNKKEREPHYSGGISINPSNWRELFFSSNAITAGDSHFSLFQANIEGDFQKVTQPTRVASSHWDQVRPVTIRGLELTPTEMETFPKVMWMENIFYEHYVKYYSTIHLK